MKHFSTQQASEQELISKLRQGDRAAFESLYDLYAPVLLGLIRKIVKDEEQSEHILKKVFIGLWQNARTGLEGHERFALHLINTARKEALSFMQTHKNQPEGNLVDTYRAGENAKTALDLIYFRGYTYIEAAKELGIPLDELRQRIKSELKQLKGVTAQ